MRRFWILVPVVVLSLLGLLAAPRALAQDATPADGGEGEGEFVLLGFASPDPAPEAPLSMALIRYTLAPGAEDPPETAADHQLAFVEAGAFAATVDGPATVQRAADLAAFELGEDLAAGDETTLEAGDAIYLPPGTGLGLANEGDEDAVALVFIAGQLAEEGPPPAEGESVEFLAFGEAAALPAGATMAMSRIGLPAGTGDEPTESDGPFLVYVEAGEVVYEVAEGEGAVAPPLAGDPASFDPAALQTVGAGEEAVVETGGWIVEQAGNVTAGRNDGDEDAVGIFAGFFGDEEGDGGTPEADGTPAP